MGFGLGFGRAYWQIRALWTDFVVGFGLRFGKSGWYGHIWEWNLEGLLANQGAMDGFCSGIWAGIWQLRVVGADFSVEFGGLIGKSGRYGLIFHMYGACCPNNQ